MEGARQETEQLRPVVVDSEEAGSVSGIDALPTTRLLTPSLAWLLL